MIFGNISSQQETRRVLKSDISIIALIGSTCIGKRSFLKQELDDLISKSDLLEVDHTVSNAREAIEFSKSEPLFGSFRAVIIDNAERLTEPAQDAYLKLFEEPPPNSRIFLITEDDGLLLSSLHSRIQKCIRWYVLSSDEMNEYIRSVSLPDDANAKQLSRGKPGFYELLASQPFYHDVYDLVIRIIKEGVDFSIATPAVIKDLSGGISVERTLVSDICSQAALSLVGKGISHSKIASFLKFASILTKYPSSNADIYWQWACLGASL